MKQTSCLILGCVLVLAGIGDALGGDGKTKAMACAACHGADGNSSNPVWPSLAGQHASYTEDQLRAFRSGQREDPNMSAMAANLSDEDIADISEYYSGQPANIGVIDAQQVAAGEKLYRGGNKDTGVAACMACHGPNGAGNPTAKYPALRGQQAEYTVLQLKAYGSGTRNTDPQNMMRDIAGRMSDAEIKAVADYIFALH
jgi:cytochrome c553